MVEKVWASIKIFFNDTSTTTWITHHLLYFSILGIVAIFILIIMLMIKVNKEIKSLDKEKRKKDKNILKFLSNKKNKTY